jgi:O-antigen ligase
MRDLVVGLVSNPVIVISSGIFVVLFSMLVLAWTNKSKKNLEQLEFCFIVFIFFCLTPINLTPFIHWRPNYFWVPPPNAILSSFQVLIYAYILLVSRKKLSAFLRRELIPYLRCSIIRNPFFWGLSFLGIASSFWSETPLITFKAGLILLIANLSFLAICKYSDFWQISTFVRWSAVPVAILSFIIRRKTNDGTTAGGGLAGILFSKNELGALMAISIILWVLTAIYVPKARLFSCLISIVFTLLLIQAKSGGAIVHLFILFLLIFAVQFTKKLRDKVAVLNIIFCILVACIAFSFTITNLGFILQRFLGKDLSFTGRTNIWPPVWDAVTHRMWTGYGLHGFWQEWRGASNPALDWYKGFWYPPNAHFGFLDAWVQLGAFGVLILITAILLSVFQAVSYLIRSKCKQAVIPIFFVTYFILANLSETRLLDFNFVWVTYSITSIKLSLESNT